MGIDEQVKMFFHAYASHFGKLTATDGAAYYDQWLRRSTVDIDDAIKVIEQLAERWDGKVRPKLSKIKQLLSQNSFEDRQSNINQSKYVAADCDMCNNAGLVWVVVGLIENIGYFINDSNISDASEMEARQHPCQCPRGMSHNAECFGEPQTFDDHYKTAQRLKLGWKRWFTNKAEAESYAGMAVN